MICQSAEVARTWTPFFLKSNVETWMTGHVRKAGRNLESVIDLLKKVLNLPSRNEKKRLGVVS